MSCSLQPVRSRNRPSWASVASTGVKSRSCFIVCLLVACAFPFIQSLGALVLVLLKGRVISKAGGA